MNAVTTKRKVVAVATSKEINQFIVDNHTTMSEVEIAEHFGVTPKSINCRLDRLRKKSVVPPAPNSKRDKKTSLVPLEKAYNHLARKPKKELSLAEIQKYILANYGKITNEEIATNLGIKKSKVSGSIAALKRTGKIEHKAVGKKAKKKVSTNTYSNADGENKQRARIKMENAVTTSGVTGTILTLPHIGCTIEKMILIRNKNMDFVGCEIDKPTYNGMVNTVRKQQLPIKTHFGAISEQIYGVDSDTYAHMILDYCGSIVSVDKEVRYTFQNDLVKVGGTVSITFSKRGHTDPNNIIKQLAQTVSNNEADKRGEMERGVEAYFNRVIGFNYAITEIFSYKDDGKGAMMMVQVKRIK